MLGFPPGPVCIGSVIVEHSINEFNVAHSYRFHCQVLVWGKPVQSWWWTPERGSTTAGSPGWVETWRARTCGRGNPSPVGAVEAAACCIQPAYEHGIAFVKCDC